MADDALWLTVDVGNSAIKGCLFRSDAPAGEAPLDVVRLSADAERWHAEIAGLSLERIRRVGLASVAPERAHALEEALRAYHPHPVLRAHAHLRAPFAVAYRTPETLGADRLAAAAGAVALLDAGDRRPLIVVDAGTAVTVDVVTRSADGSQVYEGGLIMPGPRLARAALDERTEQLPAVPLDLPPSIVGRTTAESIQSGLLYGLVAQVEGVLDRLGGEDAAVFVAGGWGELLHHHLRHGHVYAPLLIHHGLRLLMAMND